MAGSTTGTARRGERSTVSDPPTGVKVYCILTAVSLLIVIPLSATSPVLFLGTLVFGAFHAFSIYALWNMYLVGVDLAIGLSVVSVLGGFLSSSALVVVLSAVFVAYLLSVRDQYVT